MKIDLNPHAATQAQKAQAPQTKTMPPAAEGSDDGVEITLSQAAQSILKNGGPGNSGSSPAHMAAQALADGAVHDGPFGQLVKMFAHAKHVTETEIAPSDDVGVVTEPGEGGGTTVTEDSGGTGDTGDTGTTEGGDTTVTDGTGTTEGGGTTVTEGSGDTGDTGGIANPAEGGDTTVVAAPEDGDGTDVGDTDPVIVVAEPDIDEIQGGSEPTDGETTEPESGIAGSGDAVASTADGEANDGGPVGDAPAPVAPAPMTVVDTGDVTDELLELLDENSEEVV